MACGTVGWLASLLLRGCAPSEVHSFTLTLMTKTPGLQDVTRCHRQLAGTGHAVLPVEVLISSSYCGLLTLHKSSVLQQMWLVNVMS